LLITGTARPGLAIKRADLLPDSAQIDLRVSNINGFLALLKKSSFGKLWEDPQFQDFIGRPDRESWQEFFFGEERTPTDEIMLEQMKMLDGEIIIAIDSENKTYLIAKISEKDFLRSLELDEKLAEISDEPFDIVRDNFQGVLLIQHIEHGGTPEEESSWQACFGQTLLMGPEREWVEKSIVQLRKEALEEPEGNAVLDLHLPLTSLIEASLNNAIGSMLTGGPEHKVLFSALGMMDLEEFSAHIEMQNESMTIDNNLRVSDIGHGIFSLLDTAPAALPTVGFIPENATLLEVGRINLLRFWQEIPVMLSAAMPDVRPSYDTMITLMRQQLGIDIEQDLLSHMDTRYLYFTIPDNDDTISAIAFELKDSRAFKEGLETAISSPALQPQVEALFETVDLLDHTMYINRRMDPAESAAFAVAGDYLLYGHPDTVRHVIRTIAGETEANTRFEQSEMVQGLRRNISRNAFGFTAIDWKRQAAYLVRMLAEPQVCRQMHQSWAGSGIPVPPPDFEKLPPAEHLATFFNKTYQYVEKTDRGLHQHIILNY
ncbi:MAG: hypothetical protein JW713_05355, partial [Pontiellaceae bacterium]|nr:hypothetical protein [Pontiellaceae bacterium]